MKTINHNVSTDITIQTPIEFNQSEQFAIIARTVPTSNTHSSLFFACAHIESAAEYAKATIPSIKSTDSKACELLVQTNENSFVSDVLFANRIKATGFIQNDEIKTIAEMKESLAQFNLSIAKDWPALETFRRTQHQNETSERYAVKAANVVAKLYLSRLNREQCIEVLKSFSPAWDGSTAYVSTKFDDAVKRREERALALFSLTNEETFSSDKNDALSLKSDTTVIATKMGDGKTKIAKQLMSIADEQNIRSIHLSPKRTITMTQFPEHGVNYQHIKLGEERLLNKKAAVYNSAMNIRLHPIAMESGVIIGDEVTEMHRHGLTGPVGDRDLKVRIGAFNQYIEILKAESHKAFCDAFMNKTHLDFIRSVTNKPVKIINDKKDYKINLNFTLDAATGKHELIESIKAGNKIIVAIDHKDEDAMTLCKHIKKETGKKVLLINKKTFSDSKEVQSALETCDFSKYDVVVHSPLIGSGMSIENDHFDRCFVFTCGTWLPSDVLQTTRRARNVSDVTIVFKPSMNQITWTGAEEYKRYLVKINSTDETFFEMNEFAKSSAADTFFDFAVKIRKEEIEARNNSINMTLDLAKSQGFILNKIENVSEDTKRQIANLISKCRTEIRDEVDKQLLNAKELTNDEFDELLKKQHDERTAEDEIALQAISIKRALGVSELTKEDIDFDRGAIIVDGENKGQTKDLGAGSRKVLNLASVFGKKSKSNSVMDLQLKVFSQKVFEILNIDIRKPEEAELCTTITAQLVEFIEEGVIDVPVAGSSIRIKAKQALTELFPSVKVRQSIKFIRELLSNYGIRLIDSGKMTHAGKKDQQKRIVSLEIFAVFMKYVDNIAVTENEQEKASLIRVGSDLHKAMNMSRAEQSRAEQSRAEQSRAEQSKIAYLLKKSINLN